MSGTASSVLGYNILFKIGGKTIAGTTQDDFENSARIKESIYKSLQGNTEVTVTGHDFTFSAQGLMLLDSAATPTELDMDDMFANSLLNGSSAVLAFVYTRATGQSYSGNCVMTSYKESSNSEDTANWSATFRVTGALTAVQQ